VPSLCPAELTPSLSTARRLTVAGAVSLFVKVKLCVLSVPTPCANADAASPALPRLPRLAFVAADSVTALAKFGLVLAVPS